MYTNKPKKYQKIYLVQKKASGKFSIYFVKCWLCNCLCRFLRFFFRSQWYQPFKDKTEKPHFEYIRSSKKVKNLRNSYIFCLSILWNFEIFWNNTFLRCFKWIRIFNFFEKFISAYCFEDNRKIQKGAFNRYYNG